MIAPYGGVPFSPSAFHYPSGLNLVKTEILPDPEDLMGTTRPNHNIEIVGFLTTVGEDAAPTTLSLEVNTRTMFGADCLGIDVMRFKTWLEVNGESDLNKMYLADVASLSNLFNIRVNGNLVPTGTKCCIESGSVITVDEGEGMILKKLKFTKFKYASWEKNYRKIRKIGSGTFGTVNLVISRADSRYFAVKTIKRSCPTLRDGIPVEDREIQVAMSTHHPHIIKLIEVYRDFRDVHMVLEPAMHGTVYDLEYRQFLGEDVSATIITQISSALAYMHAKGVFHRDLKPDNVLVSQPLPNIHVKIADFGLSRQICRPGDQTRCGTFTYVAPEVLTGGGFYDARVDAFSLGVILFEMISQRSPYWGQHFPSSDFKFLPKVETRFINWSHLPDDLSPGARNLIEGLLQTNPKDRLYVCEVLSHPWIMGEAPRHVLSGPKAIAAQANSAKFVEKVLQPSAQEQDEDEDDAEGGSVSGKTVREGEQKTVRQEDLAEGSTEGVQEDAAAFEVQRAEFLRKVRNL